MEHYQQFIDNLIALKSYYQNQVEQYDRLAAESKEQLNHVNALLFDQLLRKQHSSNSNTEDRTETEAITHDSKALAFESAPQNTSPPELPEVNSSAILKPLAFEPKLNDTKDRTETEAITHDSKALAPATSPPNSSPPLPFVVELDSGILESPPLQVEPELKEPIRLTTDSASSEQHSAANITNESPPFISKPLEAAVEQAFESLEPLVADSAVTAATNNVEQTQPPTASTVPTSIERQHYTAPLKTPLKKEYQHLTKSEAVENFLQNNEGKTFHIDEITRSLHGDLGVEAIRAERLRMNDTLRKGVKKGLWSAVPNRDKYYTIDLNSLKSTARQQELPPESPLKSTPTPLSKYSDLLQARYRNLGLSEAVAIVVQENAGEILTPARVTKDLFGELPQTAFTKAQDQVSRYLRAGAKLGLWQRVPGQLAQYILEK